MPKIIVTSTSFSKNEILRGELLARFPTAEFNLTGANLTESALISALQSADAAIVGTESITEAILTQLPQLKMISKYGVGLDNIDIAACDARRITIGWTGGVNKTAVAEMTVAFMIALSRNLYQTSLDLKSGIWNKNGGRQFAEKTVGIIGVGHIGKELIRLLHPFGCRILVNDIVDQRPYYNSVGAVSVDKATLFSESDFVTIHTPLTPDTEYLINQTTLSMMKPTSFLLNTARGRIVNLDDLHHALQNQVIAGASLDTYENEPLINHPILQLPTLFCTPHIGGNSEEAVLAMGRSAIHHLQAFFDLQ